MSNLKTTIIIGLVMYCILAGISGVLTITYLILGGKGKDFKKKNAAKRSMLISLATFLGMIFFPLIIAAVLPTNIKENIKSIMASS